MKHILFITILFLSFTTWAKGDAGIRGACHDGTQFEFSIDQNSCHTRTGVLYLIDQAQVFCSTHCSPQSGKCSIARMNNFLVECQQTLPEMYMGFRVTCHDGSAYNFPTCSTAELYPDRAQQICTGKTNTETGEVGVKSFALNGRCN